MESKTIDPKVYSAMQVGSPYKSYIKTMLGKVYVTIINPFNDEPEGLILFGNPRSSKSKDSCIVDVWTEKEDVFFKRMNKRHFEMRHIVPFERKAEETPKEKTIAEFTDEELLAILKQPFAKLQNTVNKIELPSVIFTLIELARENEKSEKIIRLLESKLSEIQQKEFTQSK